MNEKYEQMTLKFLYEILNLDMYEKKLIDGGVKSLVSDERNGYFSLLSSGNTDLFTDDEIEKLEAFEGMDIDEIFNDKVFKEKCIDFLRATYEKYYFQNVKGEYNCYGSYDYDHIAPDDAFVLGLNYFKFIDNGIADYDKEIERQDGIVCDVINDIQFNVAEKLKLKVSVLKQTEIDIITKNDPLNYSI